MKLESFSDFLGHSRSKQMYRKRQKRTAKDQNSSVETQDQIGTFPNQLEDIRTILEQTVTNCNSSERFRKKVTQI
jgi:hypothetical protein